MESLLFLSHRIPYPPNKGDKVRSFNILKHLAAHFEIYLGTFIDDPADEIYRANVALLCRECKIISINPRWHTLKSLRGLWTGEALSVAYYDDPELRRWVREVLRRVKPRVAFAFSSTMATSLLKEECKSLRSIVDYVDVDSAKWAAYARKKPWPFNIIYRRESRKLALFERRVAGTMDRCVFVSEPEAKLFSSMLGQGAQANVHYVNNGVDLGYFEPSNERDSPYDKDAEVVVFTGAMDYWANVDAVTWFAKEIFPAILSQRRRAEFWIVGSKPSHTVVQLASKNGIRVTGTVPDIRPYLQHARVAVAPMRIARGVQNKVLEAMAMGVAVVGTSAAFEGLRIPAGYRANVEDDAELIAMRCLRLIDGASSENLSRLGRGYVEAEHTWPESMAALMKLVA